MKFNIKFLFSVQGKKKKYFLFHFPMYRKQILISNFFSQDLGCEKCQFPFPRLGSSFLIPIQEKVLLVRVCNPLSHSHRNLLFYHVLPVTKPIRHSFVIIVKIIIMSILNSSQKLILNMLSIYFLMKTITWTIQRARTIAKLVTQNISWSKVKLSKKLGF